MDSSNRNSLRIAEPVTIGNKYRFTFPMLPEDFTFAAGHRIGIVIGANFSAYGSTNGMTQTDDHARHQAVEGHSCRSSAATTRRVAAGCFEAETVAPVISAAPDVTVDSAGRRRATVVTYTMPTATDNEDPSPEVICTPASGIAFTIGQTQVTCTAT